MHLFEMSASSAVSRFLFGSGLLFLAIVTQSIYCCLFLLVVSMLLLRELDGHWLTSIRLLRLMRWFLIPVFVLHALLSPGELLMPDLLLPITKEGSMQGIRLSVHLSAIFFVAMLMFRLLRPVEWLHYILFLPYMGPRFLVDVWMMYSMKMNITLLLVDLRLQFRLRKDLKRSAMFLLAAFQQALADASDHAAMLWLRWPERKLALAECEKIRSVYYHSVSISLALLGGVAFLQAWL